MAEWLAAGLKLFLTLGNPRKRTSQGRSPHGGLKLWSSALCCRCFTVTELARSRGHRRAGTKVAALRLETCAWLGIRFGPRQLQPWEIGWMWPGKGAADVTAMFSTPVTLENGGWVFSDLL